MPATTPCLTYDVEGRQCLLEVDHRGDHRGAGAPNDQPPMAADRPMAANRLSILEVPKAPPPAPRLPSGSLRYYLRPVLAAPLLAIIGVFMLVTMSVSDEDWEHIDYEEIGLRTWRQQWVAWALAILICVVVAGLIGIGTVVGFGPY